MKSPPRLHGLDFSEDKIDEIKARNGLLQLAFFTDMPCNFRCPYCFTRDTRLSVNKVHLSFQDYQRFFVEARELGAKSLLWLGNGEPFLYEYFWELIDFANVLDLTVVFFTNGSMITKEAAERLITRNVSVYIKLNSFDPSVQERLVGDIKGANTAMKRSLTNLIEAGLNTFSPSRLGVQSIISRLNCQEIPVMYRWARKRNVVPLFELIIPLSSASRQCEERYGIDMAKAKLLFEELLEIDEEEFSFTWVPAPPYVGDACNRFCYSLSVDSCGLVHPCGGSGVTLGDLKVDSLSHILQSPLVKKIRNMKRYVEGKCRSCKNNCCGCREEAFLETGNYFAEYRRCWHG